MDFYPREWLYAVYICVSIDISISIYKLQFIHIYSIVYIIAYILIYVYLYCITLLAWVEIQCFALTVYMPTFLRAYALAYVHAYTLACVHACTLICPFMSILALKVKQGVFWHRSQEIDPDLHFVHPGGLTLGAVTRTLKSKPHRTKGNICLIQRGECCQFSFRTFFGSISRLLRSPMSRDPGPGAQGSGTLGPSIL